ncbi:MAG: tetratricopeptide repeat protein [Chromatiales bacterium]|nr:tetratricopeptide repeat protein [Chromatiales bacterium]
MPTESAFFLAGLLFLAAALGYIFARYGEPDDEPDGADRRESEYLRGFRHLLAEQPDRAVEVFSAIEELDPDTLDTHLALGTLFRRRGEIERAIAVHSNLLERPMLPVAVRQRAQLALADDYLAAGLHDRAEELLEPLREVAPLRRDALGRLIRLAEQTRDWERALELAGALEDREPEARLRQVHYLCELADQAMAAEDSTAAARWVAKAEALGRTLRSLWLRAELASESGNHAEAVRAYRQVIEQESRFLVDLLPRMSTAARAAGQSAELQAWVEELCANDPFAMQAVATAAILEPALAEEMAQECLREFLLQDPVLGELVDAQQLRRDDDGRYLAGLREALHRLVRPALRYRCTECGYLGASLQWQCPGCGAWESVRPLPRIPLDDYAR